MSGSKFHLFILLIVLLSISLGESTPRFRYRKRKRGSILGAAVGSALGVMIKAHSKPKTTKAPQIAIYMPAVAAYPNQPYIQQPLGQFNQTGHFNQTNSSAPVYAPAYAPNSIFPAVPGAPVQYPLQPNGGQPVGPFVVITNSQQTPKKNSKSSASTFNFNSGCFGLMAMASYLMVTGNRFNL